MKRARLFAWVYFQLACFELIGASNFSAITLGLNVRNKKFQINFIDELNKMVDRSAHSQLDALLHELEAQSQYGAYVPQIHNAMVAEKLEQKIVYLKQLLDLRLNEEWHNMENFYTLRNLNFLGRLKKQLQQLQDESEHELRQLRWYNLCKQFWFRETMPGKSSDRGVEGREHEAIIKLAPLRGEQRDNSTQQPLLQMNIGQFGRDLYANVKVIGAEIIDDYLLTLRKLLQEVVEEKHEKEPDSEHEKLLKVLKEIDAILNVQDLYLKRQRLYAYLENDLALDYEQFKKSAHAEEDLANILAKLQNKGMDLFVTFIFSNFEFLERIHEAWESLLPGEVAMGRYDESSQRLFRIQKFYKDFKLDWENNAKYEAYLNDVKELLATTRNGGEDMHIFQLLNNASANVGSVTFNMIKAKCDEI